MVWSFVVPRLVSDGAVEQFLALAGWEHREGRHAEAVRLYAAALEQIDLRDGRIVAAVRAQDEPAQRLEVLRTIQRCVGEIDDPGAAAEVTLPVINKSPWVPFRGRDLAIARLAFRRAAALGPRPWENEAGRRSGPRAREAFFLLTLARGRLDLVLEGQDGTPAESRAAERLRVRIAEALATGDLPTAREADRETADSDRF